MKSKRTLGIFTMLFSLTLAGCGEKTQIIPLTDQDPGTATIRIYKNNQFQGNDRYISPKNVKMKFSYNDLSGTLSNNENVCPSIGDVNLLVIPVHLPGSEAYRTDAVKDAISDVFFSHDSEKLGFKSVSDYYKEASFGKLNFQGTVTDWFDVETETSIGSDLTAITSGSNGTVISEVLRKAVDWAERTQNIDLKQYDQNQDGSIDAVWLVYDHLDWTTAYSKKIQGDTSITNDDIQEVFWNFTSWDFGTDPDENHPTTSAFSWSSFDMMYTSYCPHSEEGYPDISDLSSIPLDSHTFIHETGHLLGLDDYYDSQDSYSHPAGELTMMDQNVCDLDSYSKMLLGWVTPYVVYGTSEILIPTATSSDQAVIVVPSDYEEISTQVETYLKGNRESEFVYEFNPFSEYLMIDLYSPDGLNDQDTNGTLLPDRPQGITKTGVRIYHVDSRIFQCRVLNYAGGQKLTYESENWNGEQLEDDEAILMPISNSKTESQGFSLPSDYDYFDQIRLLEASGTNTFDHEGYASQNTLFTPDSEPFSIERFGYQFFHSNFSFNDGNDLPFRVKVNTLKEIA